MDVRLKSSLKALFTLLVLSNPLTAWSGAAPSQTALDVLRKNLAISVTKLEGRIEFCEEQATYRDPLKISQPLRDQFTKEQLLIGISYLRFRNEFACEKLERLELAFNLNYLQLNESSKIDGEGIAASINEALIYPPIEHVDYQVKYAQLPVELRQALESLIGDQPFDLMSVLTINKLIEM